MVRTCSPYTVFVGLVRLSKRTVIVSLYRPNDYFFNGKAVLSVL
jgi:hypothetical protein